MNSLSLVLVSHNNQNTKHTQQTRTLKAARKNQAIYKGRPTRIIPDFSEETLKARRACIDVMQALADHECQPRLLCPTKLLITTVPL
jgi:hypothetical protein